MKKNLLLAALGLAVSGAAFADAKSFEGYNAGLNAKMVNSSVELTGAFGNGERIDLGRDSTLASIQGGYTFAVSPKATLGIQANYTLGDTKFGGLGGDGEIKGKDAFAVSFEPGYAVSKDALVYGILSYNRIKGEVTGGATESKNFSGVGFGAGTRIKLDKNFYVQVEATSVRYSDKAIGEGEGSANFKPNSTVGSIGIGYKF